MGDIANITLNDGHAIPALGLGTWKSDPGEVRDAVIEAIRVGYRHIDCAWIYGNEAEVGEGLRAVIEDGTVTRDELFVTSKLWNDRHAPDDVEGGCRETLQNLGLERLDLYLVHWPVALQRGVFVPKTAEEMRSLDEVPLASTWAAMERLVDAGLTRSVGVSNFSQRKLAALLDECDRPPAMNQIELHPYLAQPELIAFCQSANVAVTAYSPLGSRDRIAAMKAPDEPVLLEDEVVNDIASAHDASPAQVLIAWALARGTAVIPKSVNPGRIRQNFEAAALRLRDEDRARIDALDRQRRYVNGAFWEVEGGPYTVASLWDA